MTIEKINITKHTLSQFRCNIHMEDNIIYIIINIAILPDTVSQQDRAAAALLVRVFITLILVRKKKRLNPNAIHLSQTDVEFNIQILHQNEIQIYSMYIY